jgi:hypothetical protein
MLMDRPGMISSAYQWPKVVQMYYPVKMRIIINKAAEKSGREPDTLRAGSKNTKTSRFQFFPEQYIFQPDLTIHFSPGPFHSSFY